MRSPAAGLATLMSSRSQRAALSSPPAPRFQAPPALTAMCSDGTPHSRPLLRKEVLEGGAWPGCRSTATLSFSPVFGTHVLVCWWFSTSSFGGAIPLSVFL